MATKFTKYLLLQTQWEAASITSMLITETKVCQQQTICQ